MILFLLFSASANCIRPCHDQATREFSAALARLDERCATAACVVELWLPSRSEGVRVAYDEPRWLLTTLCRYVWRDDALVVLLYDARELLLGVYTFYRWRDACLDDLGALCK